MGQYIVHSKLRHIGAQVDIQTGQHRFIADEPVKAKGTDAGPNPVQYLLSAVGGCLAITANDLANHDENLVIEYFETKVAGTTTTYQDGRSAVTKIQVTIDAHTNLSADDQKGFIRNVLRGCTVHNTLQNAVPIELTVVDSTTD